MIFHFCNSVTYDLYLDDDFSATKILHATNYDVLVIMAVHLIKNNRNNRENNFTVGRKIL